jgi:hypothetical protein
MTEETKPNPIRVAIKKLLAEDAVLKGIASGVFSKVAPADTPFPYIIISKIGGTPERTFDGEPLQEQVWLVKGVGDASDAEAIDARCREILRAESLDMEGFKCKYAAWIKEVDYPEVEQGERHDHVGAEYRVTAEKEE